MGRVLVICTDSRPALAVIRSLGRSGVEVETGLIPKTDISLRSKYVRRDHPLPGFSSEPGPWLKELNRVVAERSFDLIIPCTDGEILALQQNRDSLVGATSYTLLPDDVYEITADKDSSAALAESLGVRVPRSFPVEDFEHGLEVAEEIGFPVVLKPPTSFTPEKLWWRRRVTKAYSPEELKTNLRRQLKDGPVLIQENILGAGTGVEVLASDGRILTAFQHLRLHEELRGGISSYRKSVPLHQELYEATGKMVKALNYTGVAMFEFKLDPATGGWAFMEINGRFWGSLPLSLAAGVDFPYYLYQLLVEGREEFPQGYRTGIHGRYLPLDLEWFRNNLKNSRSDPTLSTKPLWAVGAEVLNILTLRERNDTWVLDDPKPGLAEAGILLGRARTRLLDRFHRARLGRRGFAEKEKARARRLLNRSEEVLFLCLGNICRSPLAAKYAAKLDPTGKCYLSSGYWFEAGRPSPPFGCQAAAELGVDLTDHRSGIVDKDLVDRAGVIFVHDARNWRYVVNTYPEARGKTFYLGLFGEGQGPSIPDPFGGGLDDFRSAYARIGSALSDLL